MLITDIPNNQKSWKQLEKLYTDAFKEEERETVHKLQHLVKTGRYCIKVALIEENIAGFCIVDHNHELHYSLLTFLTVAKQYRAKHIASKLIAAVQNRADQNTATDFLFVEAENKVQELYTKTNFFVLPFRYNTPLYNSKTKTTKSNLLLYNKSRKPTLKQLEAILKDIFTFGYEVNKEDPRLTKQLKALKYIEKATTQSCNNICELNK